MKHNLPWIIILIGALIVALTSCTDGGAIDPRDGLATFDTIHPRLLTEDMQVWEKIDSSRVIVVR